MKMECSAARLGKALVVALLLFVAAASFAVDPRKGDPEGEGAVPENPHAREQWFLRGRRTATGKSPAEMLQRAYQQRETMRKAQLQRQQTRQASGSAATASSLGVLSSTWTSLGPAPLTGMGTSGDATGRVTAVAVDPNDATGNTVYIAGAYGGVWKSTNATAAAASVTWTPMFDTTAPTLSVGAVAVQPGVASASSRVVLVGTGEPNSAIDSYYGLGILRSADGGSTWNANNIIGQTSDAVPVSFKGIGFSSFAFSTANNQVVVAGGAVTSLGNIFGLTGQSGAHSGVYYSSDAGATWRSATMTDGGAAIQPARVTSVVYNATLGRFFAVIAFHGIYVSTDGTGAAFTRLASQPDPTDLTTANCPANPLNSTSCHLYRGALAVRSGTSDTYAVLLDINTTTGAVTNKGVWKATISSGNVTGWTQFATAGIDTCGDSNGCGLQQGYFNLFLGAVADGANTDLYVGAVNLFRCQVTTSNTTCSNAGSWLNLTHVYASTGSCATSNTYLSMHPDFHGLGWNALGTASEGSQMFFGNDGGIYRGSTALANGACDAAGNAWADLNDTMGSLSQFIAISNHPVDSTVVLGGTQDNGSPAMSTSDGQTSGKEWFEAWGGDGGFNAIDPAATATTGLWYATNTDVSIWSCNFGGQCITAQPFSPDIYNQATADATGLTSPNFPDTGPFYTPWILDPQDSTKIIIGTCRVWRGAANTPASWGLASFTNALSNKFNGGATTACSSSDTDAEGVSAIAAGGPKTASGSQVLWVGTATQTGAGASEVFVNTNATTGVGTWTNVSAGLNNGVNRFPVSSIALDRTDTTGHTAYVTIQGFTGGSGHVFKTTNTGATWTDISGTLPDAPANAVAIDPVNHNTVYVGTDVGVFISQDGGTTWNVFGTGLPNVAVFDLKTFNSGGVGRLRAGTHGRGVWETPLAASSDYSLTISNTPLTVYAGNLPATLNGTLTAIGSYASAVTLSCQPGSTAAPATCTPAPGSAVPLVAGTPFTVSASDAAGAYNFTVEGVGSDAATTTHETVVDLNIVDFAIGTPSPNGFNLAHGTSQVVNFSVSALGPFNDTVTVNCTAPAGYTCTPASQTANPTSGSPANLSVTITNTNTSLATGAYSATLTASTAVSGYNKTQSVNWTLTTNPSFSLTGAASLADQYPNTTPSTTFGLNFVDGYTAPGGGIALSCTASPSGANSPVCTSFSPASPESAAGTVTVNLSTTNTPGGQYTMTVTGNDGSNSHSTSFVLPVKGYTLTAPVSATVLSTSPTAASTTNITISYTSTFGSLNIAGTCSVAAISGSTCQVNGGTAKAVASGATVSVQMAVTVPAATSLAAGNFSVTLNTNETGSGGKLVQNASVPVTINPDFTIASQTASQTVNAGSTASYTIEVTPAPSPNPNAVNVTCSGLPSKANCGALSITAGSAAATGTLTITTTATTTASLTPNTPFGRRTAPMLALLTGFGLPLFGVVLIGAGGKRRKYLRFWLLFTIAALALTMAACGGGGGNSAPRTIPGTPAGTYTVTVTGTASGVSHSTTVTLVVQ